jgi:hypothetical protein
MYLHHIGASVHPYQIGETIYQYISEALISFWAINTLVHMGHGAQIFWNQSRALLYFCVFLHLGAHWYRSIGAPRPMWIINVS